jgi:hypothetical protein
LNPYIIVAMVILALAVVAVGVAFVLRGQKNLFIAYDPDTGSVQPKRRRTMSGSIRFKRPDGRKVRVEMHPEYARPRMDGKGSVLVANIKTGQAMMPTSDGSWVSLDGIYLELAYVDDRIHAIRSGTGGGMDLLKLALWGIGVIIALLIVVVYQFAKAGGIS